MAGSENRELARYLTSDTFSTLVVGNKIFVGAMCAGGKPFVFTPEQIAFLAALQKLKSLAAACVAIDKSEEWAEKFFNSRKFVTFRNAKLEEAKAKAGLNTEYLILVAKWQLAGKKEWWEATCTKCGYTDEWSEYQVEACRNDAMELKPECPFCFMPVALLDQAEVFRMNREQVEMWKEAASRFWPKVDRIQHQFSREELVFEAGTT